MIGGKEKEALLTIVGMIIFKEKGIGVNLWNYFK
jgi:hypothetical protein